MTSVPDYVKHAPLNTCCAIFNAVFVVVLMVSHPSKCISLSVQILIKPTSWEGQMAINKEWVVAPISRAVANVLCQPLLHRGKAEQKQDFADG